MISPTGEPGVNIAAKGRNGLAVFQSVPMPADLRNSINQQMTMSSNQIPANASYYPGSTTFEASSLVAELTRDGSAANIARLGGPNFRHTYLNRLVIPVQRMMEEAQYSALVAQRQLAQDVQQIDSHNAPIREVNERARGILASVAGRDLGDDRDDWIGWLYDLEGIGIVAKSTSSPTPPTIIEPVPLAYQPQAQPMVVRDIIAYTPSGCSCFAGGTLVHTLRGARPIEELRLGDQLLGQDTTTGKLGYHPVVTVFHNPPNVTYRIDLGGETIFPTGFHRFWKTGHGWIMARELKAGDQLRTVGGAVKVVSIAKDRVQPVFNLLLDGGDDFCVGRQGVIAHDNSCLDPVEHPFDGVPALADLGASTKP